MNYNTQKLRGLKRKLELIKSRGGKCELCSYDRNIAVLEFHHINPDEKEFQLDMRHLSNTSLERLKEDFYEVFIDSNTTRIGLEKKRMINRQWLPGQGSVQ
jgi:hypothetical protein|nr:MAG TPA: GROUP II INTRON-ENCODED PROTEIN LTRA/RNA, GROUP II INTRONS, RIBONUCLEOPROTEIN.8A [Caudoviricetes sp.]